MLSDLIRKTALEMLVFSVRHPDPSTSRMLAESFWDYQYIYKFGILKVTRPVPELPLDWPPHPQPDPSPIDRIKLHEEVLIGMLDFLAGDPDPEPNISNILRNPNIRLAAAKTLVQRLNTALPLLNKEIDKLNKQVNQV